MRKADTGRIILLAALLLAAFSTGFYFGRSSVPFEVSVQTRLPVSRQQAETGAQTAAQTETPAQEQAAPVNLNTATLEELETQSFSRHKELVVELPSLYSPERSEGDGWC